MVTPRTVLLVGHPFVRGTLSATRSLGRQGHRVLVAATERGHAARSRHCDGFVRTPPATEPEELVRTIAHLTSSEAVDVVLSGDDEHLLVLSEARRSLEPARFPYPEHSTVLRTLDKAGVYETARRAGLSVPEFTLTPPSPAEGSAWIAKERLHRPGVTHQHFLADGPPTARPEELIYQRVVEGPLVAVIALRSPEGRMLHLGAQVSDAVFPEPFGISTRARPQPVDPDTAAGTERLLEELGWFGIAQLQFVATPGAPPAFIDLNGRFFGSLALTAAAGVDLPSAWVASAFGEDVTLPDPDPTVRYQWLEGDLRRAGLRSSHRWREVGRSLRYAPGASHSLFRIDDPRPGAVHAAELARRALVRSVRS